MRRGLLVVLVLGVLSFIPIASQGQSIEELEEQLRRQQAAEAQRQAAESQRRSTEAARRARLGVLVVRTDAPCRLSIDGEARGVLEANQPKTLEVLGGQQLLQCESTEDPSQKVESLEDVPAGAKQVVTIELAGSVVGARRAREEREAREAQERLRQEQLARRRAELAERFEVLADGVLDKAQDVVWAPRDNGAYINWRDAGAYCRSLGGEWSLPSVAQLVGLHEKDSPYGNSMATDRIQRSGDWYWSAETEGSSAAWNVSLGDGSRYSYHQSRDYVYRALCVRRP